MAYETSKKGITRRQMLKVGAVGAALPLFSIMARPANAAEFNYKFATGQAPSHPVNKRAQEAIDRIRNATNGRLDIKLFPANQLGSDTDLMSQIRNGGVEFFNQANSILSTLAPAVGIVNTGFAFPDYPAVWKAMDGPLKLLLNDQKLLLIGWH
jgi:TRAP-type transport system periplasmic protein